MEPTKKAKGLLSVLFGLWVFGLTVYFSFLIFTQSFYRSGVSSVSSHLLHNSFLSFLCCGRGQRFAGPHPDQAANMVAPTEPGSGTNTPPTIDPHSLSEHDIVLAGATVLDTIRDQARTL